MIKKLTKKQISKFPEYVDYWTKVGLSTEPADRPRAEKAIKEMYKVANLDEPKIIWTGSPLSSGITYGILKNNKNLDSVRNSVWESVWDSVRDSVWDSVRKSGGESVRDSVRNSVRNSVWDPVWDSVRDSVLTSVGDSVWNSVWESVQESVWESVRDSVRNSVRNSVWDPVWDSVRDSVLTSVGDSVWNSVRNSVRDSVWDSVRDSVRNSVRDSVLTSVRDSVLDSIYGQHYSNISSFYSFFRDECGLKKETEKLKGFIELTQSAGWALPFKNICFVSERTNKLNFDRNGRLHSESEEALSYPDGFKIYAIHGVTIPEYIIKNPSEITIEKIEKEENTEIKRIMINRYKNGYESYIKDSGSTLIDEKKDIHSNLPVKLWKKERKNDTPVVMVEIKNKTKELIDGEWIHKSYYIRVKPDITDALEAIAWHHNQTKEDYLLTQKGT
jgi:hypothetical protein